MIRILAIAAILHAAAARPAPLLTIQGGSTVTLAWDAPVDPPMTIVGYRLLSGTSSQMYDTVVDVGNVTTWTVTLPDPTRVYYFAVLAYDTEGVGYEQSDEVKSTDPKTPGQPVVKGT